MEVLEVAPKENRTRLPKMVKPAQTKTPKGEKSAPTEQPAKQGKKTKAAKQPKQDPAKKETKPKQEARAKQSVEAEKTKGKKAPKPARQSEPVKESKPVESPKAEPVVEKPRKKKFAAPTKTLAEFEAEERAFQERIARERKERNTISRAGALAGEVIMDATARLLAPRKPAAAAKTVPVKQAKPAVQPAPQSGSAPKKKEKRRRLEGPRPVELRSGRIKDSTEQPSLMKPFYFGPED